MHTDNRHRHSKRLGHGAHGKQFGFTLVELVMVIIILGVLAVYAAPRMFDTSAVNSRGFHDSALAYLRYAQKTAIAQRRIVCVAFTGTTAITLSMAQNASTSAVTVNDCTTPTSPALTGPKGETPATLTAKSTAAFTTTPANFNFNGLGQPIASSGGAAKTTAMVLQVSGVSKSITVEPATGYVHE